LSADENDLIMRRGRGRRIIRRPASRQARLKMTRVLLNNVDHQDLKVAPLHGREFGDSVNQMLVFPTEFEALQREYPIFFRRGEDEAWQAVVLLGLDREENLFLEADGSWNGRHVPALAARGPFSIGLERGPGGAAGEPMIHIDLDDPRVGTDAGEPLFLPQGGNSPYLQEIARRLGDIWDGMEVAPEMFAAFEAAGLIEPVQIEILLSDTERYDLADYSSIAPDRLAALDGETLVALNQPGHLRAAFLVLASQGNVERLIARKTLKRQAG
jgi:hypothetical protein